MRNESRLASGPWSLTHVVDDGDNGRNGNAEEVVIVEAFGHRVELRAGEAPRRHFAKEMTETARQITECAAIVTRATGVSLERMRSDFRNKIVTDARATAMWLAHKRHGVHPSELAAYFRKDRSTCIVAIQKVEEASEVR